jgi:hypothetical protein
MKHSSKLPGYCAAAALALATMLSAAPLRAQEPAAKPEPQIEAAAQKLFKAIADQDLDTVKSLTIRKYAKRLTKDELRPVPTGPKLAVAFDGKVDVIKAGGGEAIVETSMFKPDASDVPQGEARKLDIFLVKEHGEWLADAPDRRQAASDATMEGGWYHPGKFTWCPNKGLEFEGSHFANKLYCRTTAVCR